MFEELWAQLIERGEWKDYERWTVWAIRFIAEQSLLQHKGKVERAKIKEAVETKILRYLGFDKKEGRAGGFVVHFELSAPEIENKEKFYESLLKLYSLRNPQFDTETIPVLIKERRSVRLGMDYDPKQRKYFVRAVDIIAQDAITEEATGTDGRKDEIEPAE